MLEILDDDDEMSGEDGQDWKEDFLLLLTPFALSKPAQLVLQWMLSKHKIHETHPEILIWAILPYYEFKLFNKVRVQYHRNDFL